MLGRKLQMKRFTATQTAIDSFSRIVWLVFAAGSIGSLLLLAQGSFNPITASIAAGAIAVGFVATGLISSLLTACSAVIDIRNFTATQVLEPASRPRSRQLRREPELRSDDYDRENYDEHRFDEFSMEPSPQHQEDSISQRTL